MTVRNPSLVIYTELHRSYSHTLRCPCSTTTIPYNEFISLSPILHQVCTSDLVNDPWLETVQQYFTPLSSQDWRNRAFSYFQLLNDLCKLANKTIDDAVHRFLSQPFVASSVISEMDFNTQSNATLEQFYQSTITYFDLLVETVYLLMQVDQPHMESLRDIMNLFDTNLLLNIITNETNNHQSLQVQLTRNTKVFPFFYQEHYDSKVLLFNI